MVDHFDDDKTQSYVALTRGTVVDHYQVVEKIGAGAMGEVYLALDTKLNRKVALKFLPSHLSQDDDCRARFKREAQAVAKLNHPNVIHVYEVSEYHGRPFFAMELAEGQSLRDLANGKDTSVDRIIELAIQICDGLSAAHDKKIVHRDIKPSNIVIDAYGRPKILDFGLAAIQGGEQLTKTGSTLGTVRYMSPEQIQGQRVDHRSDLFSLGVVLYELISGQTPFERENVAATMNAITRDSPDPISRHKTGIPEGLQRTISKLLEKDPSLRYQSATGVTSDLKIMSRNQGPAPSTEPSQLSVAVLPFENLSADPEQEYFCDGVAEEIINALTRVENLHVVARTSSFAFKSRHEDVREIGRQLNVSHVLEGSVRKSGSRIRITGQLVKISDGYHLWSDRYDRELNDIFEIQDEISIAIVEKLRVTLVGEGRQQIVKRPTDNLEAYNLYLRGRYHWNNRTRSEIQKAIECLKKAIELDPEFPLAYASLADAYVVLDHNFGDRSQWSLAEEAVFKALKLDDSLAEAHTALAQVRHSQWMWRDAEKQYLTAIRLNPGYATAHHWYAIFLTAKGKFEQALEQIKIARDIDRLSPAIIAYQAFVCYLMGQYDKAIGLSREGLEINPRISLFPLVIGWSLLEKGDLDEAMKQFFRGMELHRTEQPGEYDPAARFVPSIGIAYAMMGQVDKAKEVLDDAIANTSDKREPFFPIAGLYFMINNKDRGFEYLERSIKEREYWLPIFRFSPPFDDVRTDSRFVSLMKEIGLDDDTST